MTKGQEAEEGVINRKKTTGQGVKGRKVLGDLRSSLSRVAAKQSTGGMRRSMAGEIASIILILSIH